MESTDCNFAISVDYDIAIGGGVGGRPEMLYIVIYESRRFCHITEHLSWVDMPMDSTPIVVCGEDLDAIFCMVCSINLAGPYIIGFLCLGLDCPLISWKC